MQAIPILYRDAGGSDRGKCIKTRKPGDTRNEIRSVRPAVFYAPISVLSSFAFAVVLLKEKIVVGETGDVDGFDVLVEE